jgi:hypothetical protein
VRRDELDDEMEGRQMSERNPKGVRRQMLLTLYNLYFNDPLEMYTPEDFLENGNLTRRDLIPNSHFLNDCGLIEMMIGYRPPLFDAVRITAAGVELVENETLLNLRFPPDLDDVEGRVEELPILVERLVEEADLSPLDGEARMSLLRDVQYLRDELSRPPQKQRRDVIDTVLEWIGAPFENPAETLPSWVKIRERIDSDAKSK